jgi:predicted membrane-bound mannosyltransferase
MKATTVAVGKTPVQVETVKPLGLSITAEAMLYAVIVGVAAVLRLWNLQAAPLTVREAAQALAAFNGLPLPAGGSPLLYGLNQVLVGLFSTTVNDAGVRLGAALIGTVMVLLPVLFRSHIGRYGVLAAALMLALSPTLVVASRSLDGAIGVATCTLAAIGLGLRYFTTQKPINLIGLAIAIGVALACGSGVITVALVIVPALIIIQRWVATDEDRLRVRQLQQESHVVRQAVLWGGAAFILAATTFFLRPNGLASVPEILSAWLAAWANSATGANGATGSAQVTISVVQLVQILLAYEPLILCFGLVGLIFALRRTTGLSVLLSVWAIGALLIVMLQPGRQVLDLTLVLTPLALLGGSLMERIGTELQQQGSWRAEGLFALLAAIMFGFAVIRAGNAAMGLVPPTDSFLGARLSVSETYLIGVALVVFVLVAVFVVLIGWHATVRAVAMTLFALLAVMSWSSAWRVTQLRPADPRELLWGPTTTSTDVRAMTEAIAAASKRNTGFLDQVPIAVTLPQDDPVVRWYLRNFKNAQYNAVIADLAPVIVAPPGSTFPPNMSESYQGKQFVMQTQWDTAQLSDTDFMRWWLYRESDLPPAPVQTLVVWLKAKP